MSTSHVAASSSSSSIEIVGKGIAMGFLHVMAGPDHLSALATLSSNLGNCKAFQLGVRWGIGHSAGLVLVATIILVSSSGGEIAISDTVTIVLQTIVGVFMICLGIYSLRGAVRRDKYRQNQLNNYALRSTDLLTTSTDHPQKKYMDLDFSYDERDGIDNAHFSRQEGEASLSMADVDFHHQQASNRGLTSLETKSQNSKKLHLFQIDDDAADDDIENEKDSPVIDVKDQHHNHLAENDDDIIIADSEITSSNRNKLAAFAIGIVHGIAGPGGVLGILPAIELHNYGLAYTYLGSFCVTSILVMGTFSAAYGVCTKEISQRVRIEFHLDCFSASLSLLVGIIWLCLLYTGNLGKVIG